jgi:hypothetical protein
MTLPPTPLQNDRANNLHHRDVIFNIYPLVTVTGLGQISGQRPKTYGWYALVKQWVANITGRV